MRCGRVIAREAGELRIRSEGREMQVVATSDAQPGDWVAIKDSGAVSIVQRFAGEDFPKPHSETVRLNPGRIRGLENRAAVLAEIRQYFSEEAFLEIEPPTLVSAPGLEVNIKAVEAQGGYLITSPEFSMKRLLAGGFQRIYSMPRCFRSEEEGVHHSIEFTMLEWYRAFDDLSSIMRDTEALVHRVVQRIAKRDTICVGEIAVDVRPPWKRMSIQEAFALWAKVSLAGDESAIALAAKAASAGIDIGSATAWDDIFYVIFLERVQPALEALDTAVFLTDWPAPLAALARTKSDAPQWALRFEAYVGGVELANAFDELTCPTEQRRRFVLEQAERSRRGKAVYPIDENFMAALEEGLPPCAGIALGVDRLAMLASEATQLRDVCAFFGDEI